MIIKAIIFDMDGVLIDSEPFWKNAEIEEFAKVGLHMTVEMCNQTMGFRCDETIAYWFAKHPWKGVSKEEMLVLLTQNVKRQIIASGKAMAGVMKVIDFAKANNLKLAVASSSSMELILEVVTKLGIKPHFDILQSAENEEYGKPHPAVFLAAAQKLQLKPSDCLVIEDSINGVIAAKAAKMKVIAVPDPTFSDKNKFAIADFVVDSLEEFDLRMVI